MLWEEFVSTNLTRYKEDELRARLGSSHKFTKMMRSPKNATNVELLILADVFNIHPYDLIHEFEGGVNHLTEEELTIYRRLWLYEQKKQNQAA